MISTDKPILCDAVNMYVKDELIMLCGSGDETSLLPSPCTFEQAGTAWRLYILQGQGCTHIPRRPPLSPRSLEPLCISTRSRL